MHAGKRLLNLLAADKASIHLDINTRGCSCGPQAAVDASWLASMNPRPYPGGSSHGCITASQLGHGLAPTMPSSLEA